MEIKTSIFFSQAVSDAMLVELKACFMEAYDDNQDGKIDIREVNKISRDFHYYKRGLNSKFQFQEDVE